MSTRPIRRGELVLAVLIVGFSFQAAAAAAAQPRRAADPPAADVAVEDKPKVAIIQYESGRVLVVRVVNGELLVVESPDRRPFALRRYLVDSEGTQQPRHARQPKTGSEREPVEALPLFYSPQWYPYRPVIGPYDPLHTAPIERSIERKRQNAAELRQQVKARRDEQGATGTTNSAGRIYPSTAADLEHGQAVDRPYSGVSYGSFYNLGYELEYYRQQELAAREELTLLTYDVLLAEGMTYFRSRRYAQAARSFIAASQKDHGDAASRLHAAQCLMASGLYSEALAHVRRAFELAPQLIYRPLNHRENYAFPRDFDRQVAELEQYVRTHMGDDDAVLLLAYEQFFSARPATARKAMTRVRTLANSDGFAKRLWKAAQPMMGDL